MSTDHERLILDLCKKHAEGVSDETLQKEIGDKLTVQERASAINKLLQSSRIELFSGANGLVYKSVNIEQVTKFRGLTAEDLLVYQTIERTSTSGIWTKDLRYSTNLAQPVLNKILKTLENRHLVKTFRPVENKTRKMYIVFNLEPAEHLTGGAWYTDSEKDTEFIEVLREACYKKISHSGTATLSEIFNFIKSKALSRVTLHENNVKSVVDTLVYEGRIDEVQNDEGTYYRPALLTLPDSSPLTAVPCGVCPLFHDCKPGGLVSPDDLQLYDIEMEIDFDLEASNAVFEFPETPPGFASCINVIEVQPTLLASDSNYAPEIVDQEDTQLAESIGAFRNGRIYSSGTNEVFEASGVKNFDAFGLSELLKQGIYSSMGFDRPSEIQAQSLPLITQPPYPSLVAQAHNGSGKTCCFVCCILSRLDYDLESPQALVVVPTRELAIQNANIIQKMGKFTKVTVVCSCDTDKIHSKATGLKERVVVSTMGSLEIWIRRGWLLLNNMKVVVFDEADLMIDKGSFADHCLHLMLQIEKSGPKPQVLLFSATFSDAVRDLTEKLFHLFKRDHVYKTYIPDAEISLDTISQANVRCRGYRDKIRIVRDRILPCSNSGKTIIFVRFRSTARALHDSLTGVGWSVTSISGEMEYLARDRVIREFRNSVTNVLISTDILARGFDVLDVKLVVNFDIPIQHLTREPAYETYLHRVGRSGRFMRNGAALNFIDLTSADNEDEELMKLISAHFDRHIPILDVDSEGAIEGFFRRAGLFVA
eukprot:g2003.t1